MKGTLIVRDFGSVNFDLIGVGIGYKNNTNNGMPFLEFLKKKCYLEEYDSGNFTFKPEAVANGIVRLTNKNNKVGGELYLYLDIGTCIFLNPGEGSFSVDNMVAGDNYGCTYISETPIIIKRAGTSEPS